MEQEWTLLDKLWMQVRGPIQVGGTGYARTQRNPFDWTQALTRPPLTQLTPPPPALIHR